MRTLEIELTDEEDARLSEVAAASGYLTKAQWVEQFLRGGGSPTQPRVPSREPLKTAGWDSGDKNR